MISKRLICLAAVFLSVSFLASSLSSQESKQDERLAEAWRTFQQAPSSENALRLYQSLPDNLDSARNVYLSQQKILQSICDHFEVLKHRLLAEDRNSVKVAYRLLAVSDGDFSETIGIALGQLIKINPRMFLQELKAHRILVRRLDGLLCNLGEQNVDSFDSQAQELKARIKVLQAIKGKDLFAIRDECIAVLKEICDTLSQK